MILGLVRKEFGGKDIGHHLFDISVKLGFLCARIVSRLVLGGNDDRGCGNGLAIFETQRDLALRIRFKEGGRARMAVGGHPLEDLVAVIERCRHQVGCFIAGKAEHDTLIARSFVLVARSIDALRYVGRLGVKIVGEIERLPVKPVLLIANVLHDLADRILNLLLNTRRPVPAGVHDALAPDFARKDNLLRCGQRFAGHARFGILRQEQIDDRIRNLVGDLVGMAFGNAFGRKEVIGTHAMILLDIRNALYVIPALSAGIGQGQFPTPPRKTRNPEREYFRSAQKGSADAAAAGVFR